MKKLAVFIWILLFSVLFVVSFMFGIPDRSYGHALNIAGQVGMALGILYFLVFKRKAGGNGKG